MTKKKKLIVSGIGAAAIVSLALGTASFAADSNGRGPRNDENRPKPTAEEMAAHHQEMQTKIETALKEAVTAGKLTEDQKSYIIAQQTAIHEKMVAGDKDGADKLRDELHTWMETNNIDKSVMPRPKGHGPKDGKGPKGPRHGQKSLDSTQ